MNNIEELFPKFQKNIEDLIEDEEGNIPGQKLLMLGTMVVVLGSLMQMNVFAAHRSHSSHVSHSSHSSGVGGHGSHVSHESHSSHTSHSNTHSSHASHTSHSNTASHSNSAYSSEGDVTYKAPAAEAVPAINMPAANTFKMPDVNQNIELPNGTPVSSIMPSLAVPSSSVATKMDVGEIHQPSATESVE